LTYERALADFIKAGLPFKWTSFLLFALLAGSPQTINETIGKLVDMLSVNMFTLLPVTNGGAYED